MVPLFGVLLRGRILCEHHTPSWQWDFWERFQSPFASPPGVGLASSLVNVLWGLFNLAIAYLLVCRVDSFNLRTMNINDDLPTLREIDRPTSADAPKGLGQFQGAAGAASNFSNGGGPDQRDQSERHQHPAVPLAGRIRVELTTPDTQII
jgi:hypothetical protein